MEIIRKNNDEKVNDNIHKNNNNNSLNINNKD